MNKMVCFHANIHYRLQEHSNRLTITTFDFGTVWIISWDFPTITMYNNNVK